jgi:hypothetical protein
MKKSLILLLFSAFSFALSAQTTTNAINTLDAGSAATGSIFRVSASTFANGKKKYEVVPITSLISGGAGISIDAGGVISSTITQANGAETKVTAGSGISLSGLGTIASPYIVTATATAPDGSETKVSAGAGIGITGSGTTASPYSFSAIDASTTNEIQTISLSANTLSLSLGGGSVVLPSYDGSETKVTAGAGIGITGLGTTASPYIFTNSGDGDNSATNEIQTLSLSNSTFTLSNGGGSVTLKRWVYKAHTKAVATATLAIPAGAPAALTDIQVYIGGVKMTPSSDNYTVSGTTLTFVQGAPAADVEVLYWE